jgi:hypothetical protein
MITGRAIQDARLHAMRMVSKWGGQYAVFGWRRKLYIRPLHELSYLYRGHVVVGVADGRYALATCWHWLYGG